MIYYYNINSMDFLTKQYLVNMLIGHHKLNGILNVNSIEDLKTNNVFVDTIVYDNKTKIFNCKK